MTIPVRCFIWLFASNIIIPPKKIFFKYYFTLDNLTLLMLLTYITYVSLNSSNVFIDVWKTFAIFEWIFLFFCLNGNFRVMCKFMIWFKSRVIIYKVNRIYGCCSYMVFGILTIIYPTSNLDKDLYLLYIFIAVVYFS